MNTDVGLKIIAVRTMRHYEVITLPQSIFPNVDLENRSLVLLTKTQVVFFNDGVVSFLRPN